MSNKIILIGGYPPPYGGVSIHIKRLKLVLQQRGMAVDVLAQPDSHFEDEGVYSTRIGPMWYMREFFRCDNSILHYHTSGFNSSHLWLLTMLALRGRPVVVTLHSFRDENRINFVKFYSMISATSLPLPHIICVGSEIRDKIVKLGVDSSKTSLISSYLPPVINEHDRQQIHPSVDYFLSTHQPIITANAYRLKFFKGQDLYGLDMCVDLCKAMVRDYPRLGFVFALPDIGDEKYYASILQRLTDLNLNGHFCFSHKRAEYWPIIERSSVFVRPTNTDSYGISVAEAIDLGIPAIASDVCQRTPGTILFRKRDFQDLLKKTRKVLNNLDEYKQCLADCKTDRTATVEQIMTAYRTVWQNNCRLTVFNNWGKSSF